MTKSYRNGVFFFQILYSSLMRRSSSSAPPSAAWCQSGLNRVPSQGKDDVYPWCVPMTTPKETARRRCSDTALLHKGSRTPRSAALCEGAAFGVYLEGDNRQYSGDSLKSRTSTSPVFVRRRFSFQASPWRGTVRVRTRQLHAQRRLCRSWQEGKRQTTLSCRKSINHNN